MCKGNIKDPKDGKIYWGLFWKQRKWDQSQFQSVYVLQDGNDTIESPLSDAQPIAPVSKASFADHNIQVNS